MEKIKIIIADDHAVLRSGLRIMLNQEKDMEVIGEAANGAQLINICKKMKCDLVLLDLNMPDGSGLSVLPVVKELMPELKVLVLTMHQDESYLKDVLKAGGNGFITKRVADKELLSAIRLVMQGGIFVEPSLAKYLVYDMVRVVDDTKKGDTLSPREEEVICLIAKGYTNNQIAQELVISIKTVETHKAKIKNKLNLSRRSELVKYAIDNGLVKLE